MHRPWYSIEKEGGKAMTMTPWNLTHGPWSKWLFCGQTLWLYQTFTILTIGNSYFGHGPGHNGKFCRSISWLNFRLTILTMENLDFGRCNC